MQRCRILNNKCAVNCKEMSVAQYQYVTRGGTAKLLRCCATFNRRCLAKCMLSVAVKELLKIGIYVISYEVIKLGNLFMGPPSKL